MSCIQSIAEHPELVDEAARWFSGKWGIPAEAYRESMLAAVAHADAVPQWYVVREERSGPDAASGGRAPVGASMRMQGPQGGSGAIIAGCGIIENDFHDRPDLAPNLCALYVEEGHRGKGLARLLLGHARAEAARLGFDMLYLVTEHVGLYERCGWRYLGDASELDGGKIRLYGAPSLDAGDAGGSRCMC